LILWNLISGSECWQYPLLHCSDVAPCLSLAVGSVLDRLIFVVTNDVATRTDLNGSPSQAFDRYK